MDSPKNWHRAHKDKLSTGEQAADLMRNGMGSWRFVFGFLLFMAGWAFVNTLSNSEHWDNYPFILLNLFLSMLAALQGAILLIAAKRADSISAAMAANDYSTDLQSKRELEELMSMNRKQLALIEDLLHKLKSQ